MIGIAILFALPAITGLASVLWSQVTATSRLYMAGLNVLSYAAVFIIVAALDGPTLPRSLPNVGPVAGYVVLSVIISLLWFQAAPLAPIGVLALSESAYPLFVLLISRVLVGSAPLSWTTCIGAVLVMVGLPLVAIGAA